MAAYIIDNSIWWKASRFAHISDRLRRVATSDLILTCPPQVLEYCHSARNADEYAELRQDMEDFIAVDVHPTIGNVLDVQQALWAGGLMRGAGAIDVHIATYAIANHAIVLTSDHDYDHIATAVPSFRHEYLSES